MYNCGANFFSCFLVINYHFLLGLNHCQSPGAYKFQIPITIAIRLGHCIQGILKFLGVKS